MKKINYKKYININYIILNQLFNKPLVQFQIIKYYH